MSGIFMHHPAYNLEKKTSTNFVLKTIGGYRNENINAHVHQKSINVGLRLNV